ncbi:hypothetical protein B0H14DRAFT_2969404, partial [Mycena olivaceomarginata]
RRAISQWCGAAFARLTAARAAALVIRLRVGVHHAHRPVLLPRVRLARDSTFEAAMLRWTRRPVRCRSCPSLLSLAFNGFTGIHPQAHRRSYSRMRRCVIRGQEPDGRLSKA